MYMTHLIILNQTNQVSWFLKKNKKTNQVSYVFFTWQKHMPSSY